MELINKSKALNILVPNLINKNELLTKEIKTRIKFNKIFSEFENKASRKLNYFIQNSCKRYNCTKYGNDLNIFLLNNRSRNESEANNILNDKFYKDKNIGKEREKMKFKSTSKLYKDIKETFNNMKIPLDNVSNKDSRKQMKKLINKIKSNLKRKDINLNLIKTKKRNIIHNTKQNISENKELINSQINAEEKLIENSISKYLKDLKNVSGFNKTSPWEILNSTPYKDKPNINLPNIEFINYVHKNNRPIKRNLIKKDIISKPDITKLLPYSKIGKNKKKFKKRKELSLNDIESHKYPFITEANIIVNKNDDFRNTVNIVYNSANKELQIENYLDKKRRKINELFEINDIPLLNTYDDILFKNTERIKTERYNEAKMLNNKQKSEIFTEREKANDNIEKKIIKLDEIENNYYNKIKDNINYIKKLANS